MEDKTFEEALNDHLMSSINTLTLARIIKINASNGFIEAVGVTNKTIYNNVPLLQLGNSSINIKINLKVGDYVPLFHVKEDISLFLSQGTEEDNKTLDLFSDSNCIALPFKLFNFNEGFKMPEIDFEIIGNLKVTGNLELIGDIKQTGKIESTGEIKSDADVKASNISLKNHVHAYTWTDGAGAGNTQIPS